jgi:antimicrobial peptide system SdpB family protein
MRQLIQLLSQPAKFAGCSNVYGLARTVLALGTLLTLLFNNINILICPSGKTIVESSAMSDVASLSIFAFFSVSNLFIAQWVCIIILLFVISGWMPRYTGILHWWVSFSFANSCIILDGGDQITSILTLFLIPISLTDNREWHWQKISISYYKAGVSSEIKQLVSQSCYWTIRLQVAVIYFHAAIGKLGVTEWIDGTAVYYWFTHPTFGLAETILQKVIPLLATPLIVMTLTWGTIALEILLSSALVMDKKWWKFLIVPAIVFHLLIWLVHGLFSFFFAMTGAIILYLRPFEAEFRFTFSSYLFKLFHKNVYELILRNSNKIDSSYTK